MRIMTRFNEILLTELEDKGLNNIHSLSLLLMIQNKELFNDLELEEYIHDSPMGEFLIKEKIIMKLKSNWVIPLGLFDNILEQWKEFKSRLFTEYGFTLKGHPENQIGYLIKDELECARSLSTLLTTAHMDNILESADEYYKEGEYLRNLDNWLKIVEVAPPKRNKFI